MKAKLSIWTMTAVAGLFLAVSTVNAGLPQSNIYATGTVVVNNYNLDDFGYHYSSRINRFHNSYSTFDYYAPVFTETYWYNYEPYTWGMTIYSNGGFGVRYGSSWSFPAYYNTGWYDMGYPGSYYYGYSPFFFDWYTPVVINVRIRNYYPDYYNRYYGHNHYRVGYNVVNNYYGNNYYGNINYSNPRYNYPSSPYPSSSSNASISRRSTYSTSAPNSNSSGRREVTTGASGTSTGASDRRAVVNPNNNTGNPATVTNSGRGTVTRSTGTTNVQRNAGSSVSNRNTVNTGNTGNTGNSVSNRSTISNSSNRNVNTDTRSEERRVRERV